MLIGIFNPMGAQSDRLRCEVCQNLFLSPMNTGLLRYAVATVLTVYGIETEFIMIWCNWCCNVATVLTVYGIETLLKSAQILLYTSLQQFLPFTVLKPYNLLYFLFVQLLMLQQFLPFTVLKLIIKDSYIIFDFSKVATVLTVYGIETLMYAQTGCCLMCCNSSYRLRY